MIYVTSTSLRTEFTFLCNTSRLIDRKDSFDLNPNNFTIPIIFIKISILVLQRTAMFADANKVIKFTTHLIDIQNYLLTNHNFAAICLIMWHSKKQKCGERTFYFQLQGGI